MFSNFMVGSFALVIAGALVVGVVEVQSLDGAPAGVALDKKPAPPSIPTGPNPKPPPIPTPKPKPKPGK